MSDDVEKPKSRKGLAALSPEKRRLIASMGGKSVPKEKRTFARNRAVASAAGKKGGRTIRPESRTFAIYPELASMAGRIGGSTSVSQKKQAERNCFFLNLYSGDKHVIIMDDSPSFNLERAQQKMLDALAAQNLHLEPGWRVEVRNRQGDLVLRMRDRARAEAAPPDQEAAAAL
ncbi:MAG: general stress protein [Beijerinckiaceae bacterium]